MNEPALRRRKTVKSLCFSFYALIVGKEVWGCKILTIFWEFLRNFESVKSNNEFVILKKHKDMPQPPQEKVKNKKNKEI